jgi:hypothetical protein
VFCTVVETRRPAPRPILATVTTGLRRCVPKVLSVGVFGGKVSVVPPLVLLVAPPNRSPRQRLSTPSPVKELPKGTGGLKRLPPLDLGDGGPETTHEG